MSHILKMKKIDYYMMDIGSVYDRSSINVNLENYITLTSKSRINVDKYFMKINTNTDRRNDEYIPCNTYENSYSHILLPMHT